MFITHHSQIMGSAHAPINQWMDKENVVYIHDVVLIIHKEWNYVIYRKMDGTRDHHVKWNEPDQEREIPSILSYIEFRS
jgi:hypothetical protein